MSGEVLLPGRWGSKPWNVSSTAVKFPVFIHWRLGSEQLPLPQHLLWLRDNVERFTS